jgi:hypothetical protein
LISAEIDAVVGSQEMPECLKKLLSCKNSNARHWQRSVLKNSFKLTLSKVSEKVK